MHLTYRPAQIADVEPCLALLPLEFVCAPALRARLPDVWRQWLGNGAMKLTVVEQGERPPASRLAGFGSSVFVTDAFVVEAQTSLPPPLAAQVAQKHLEGRSPVLSREAVGRANGGEGLNLLILIIGWARERLTAEDARWVKAKIFEAFFFTHGGYNVKHVMQEVYSEEERERGEAIGVRLLTDYGKFYDSGALPLPPPAAHPFLIGARREEVRDGSALSPLFFYAPPRFFFKPGEQEMLLQALLGASDEELASALHVSLSTVHKRWQALYERVAVVAPDLLPSARDASSDHRRGVEKRRHLLTYLRSHLEELRPIQ